MKKFLFVLILLVFGCKPNKPSIQITSNELVYYEYTQEYLNKGFAHHAINTIAISVKVTNNSKDTVLINNKSNLKDALVTNDTLFELSPYLKNYLYRFGENTPYYICPKESMNITFITNIPLEPITVDRLKSYIKRNGSSLRIASLAINQKDTILQIPIQISNLKDVFVKNDTIKVVSNK